MKTFSLPILFILIAHCHGAVRNLIVFHNNIPSSLFVNSANGPHRVEEKKGDDPRLIRLHLYPSDKLSRSPKFATVVLDNGQVQGVLRLTQMNPPVGSTRIEGYVNGLAPGEYEINVHRLGDIQGGCDTIGEIYNPYTLAKEWQPYQRYMGDVGSVTVDKNGIGEILIDDPFISLVGPRAIIGKALSVTKIQSPETEKQVIFSLNEAILPEALSSDYTDRVCGVIGTAS